LWSSTLETTLKHDEIYDKHAPRLPKQGKKRKNKDSLSESRYQRISFKNYVRELEEELLEDDLNTPDSDD